MLMISAWISELKPFAILLLAALLILLFDNLGFLNIPKAGLEYITTPVQYGLYKTSSKIGQQFEYLSLARTASQQIKALHEQQAQILSENADLRRQLAEAKGFLDQQKALDPLIYSVVAARPISLSRYVLIDKGSNDGIKVGQPVVYKEVLLGQIIEVTPKTARVRLLSDPDSKVAAFVSSKNGKAKGILLGQFGSDLLLDKVLHEEPMEQNDLVYSEGSEGNFPRGLVLGQISQVMDRPNEIFKQAKIKPVFDIGDLDIVFVITN